MSWMTLEGSGDDGISLIHGQALSRRIKVIYWR